MSDIDLAGDKTFHEIFGTLLNEMVMVHRCSFEEAFHIVRDEIKGEYDQRVRARRAAFRVIGTSPHIDAEPQRAGAKGK